MQKTEIDKAKSNIAETIGYFIPLTKKGHEYTACCPFHEERTPSFTISPAKEFYHCFGCGASGDAIGFVMEYQGLSFVEAVQKINGSITHNPVNHQSATQKPKPSVWKSIRHSPATAARPDFKHYRLGQPSAHWSYRDITGELIGYVCRFETETGKEVLPLSWAVNTSTGEMQWRWLGFGVPRPLYGLDKLSNSTRKVLLVEGEKKVEPAQALFKGMDALSWVGGSNAIKNIDWSPLYGKPIVLWPDNDQAGIDAMRAIYEQIKSHCPDMRIVPPYEQCEKGWDLADAPPEGFNPVEYAKAAIVACDIYFAEPIPEPAVIPDTEQHANDRIETPNEHAESEPSASYFGSPVDVFGTMPPKPIPIAVLPPQIASYINDQADLIGCDPSIIAIGALVSAAACIHDGIQLQPKRRDPTWREQARIWGAVVGSPSTRKSPGLGKAMRHVKRIDHDMSVDNQKKASDYKNQMEQFKDAKKQDKTISANEPQAPQPQRVLIEDSTIEAMSEVLKDNPRGIMCYQDELTGWFGSMDAYKSASKGASKDRAHWLEAYNGGRRTIDRITRGSFIIPNWSVCVLGGIQPDMIRTVANSMGQDGLLQRFIIIVAQSAKQDADRVPDMKAMESYKTLFDALIQLQPSADVVKMSEGAHESRERVSEYASRLINAFMGSPLESWVGKWDGLYSRLCLIYHCIDCISKSVHPSNALVSQATAIKVEKLLCGTLLHHAIHFYSEIVDSHGRQENIRQLARLILARGTTSLSKRDMNNYWKASRKLEWHQIRDVTTNLCNMDWLAPDYNKLDTDGRPRAWTVNPEVHAKFKIHADAEVARRREIVQTLADIKNSYDV